MKYWILAILLVSVSSLATEWTHQEQISNENWQRQAQNQQSSSQSVSQGGNVGDISSETRMFAFSGNITQVQVSDCYIPARRFGRSQNYLWGLFSVSALVKLDPECVAAKLSVIEAQARLLEAQNEAKRIERLEREVSACRQRDVCENLLK